MKKQREVLYTGLDSNRYKTDGRLTHIPLIQIVPRPASDPDIKNCLQDFPLYSHVIITSKNAVNILCNYLTLFGFSSYDVRSKTFIAVGTGTAARLKHAGMAPTIVAQEETAEGIIKEIETMQDRNSYYFWPHSSRSRSVLLDFFLQSRLCFAHCSLYDTLPVFLESPPDIARFDEVVFTSPSTVDAFLHIFGSLPKNALLTPIGPVTKDYLACLNNLS